MLMMRNGWKNLCQLKQKKDKQGSKKRGIPVKCERKDWQDDEIFMLINH